MTGVSIPARRLLATGLGQLSSVLPPGTRSSAVSIAGFVVLSAVGATIVAVCYRRVTTRTVPLGAAVIVGLAPISLWLSGRIVGSNAVVSDLSLVLDATGYFLLVTFGAGGLATVGGRRLGDAIARELYDLRPTGHSEETAKRRRSARQAKRVQLPETIRDRWGTEPVDRQLKQELAGSTWSVPGGLSAEAVESRLVTRLECDYGIDRVEIEMDGTHSVTRLAIGTTPSGASASLPPRTVGVAVRSHLGGAASVGDPVDVWTDEDERVAFAGRATVEEATNHTTTLVLPAGRHDTLVGADAVRLTTKPADPDDEADFRSVLGTSDHAIERLSIEAGGPLEGEFVGWLAVSVLVIVRDGEVIAFPEATETVRNGDDVYVFGGPTAFEALARFERERRSDDSA